MEQGKVIIGCEITTKEFDKQIAEIEKKLNDVEATIGFGVSDGLAKKDIEELELEAEKLRNKLFSLQQQRDKLAKQEIQKEFIPDINVAGENQEVQNLVLQLNQLKFAYDNINRQTLWTDDDVDKLDNIEEKAKELIEQLEKLTGKKWQIEGFGNIPKDLDEADKKTKNLGKGLESVIKKVGKWALAVFGVRSAYNAIRGAMSTLSQYDTQMASNIEYIRYALASSLQPVIQTILNLVVKLLQYINYIAKAWTGKNLFKTADAFKNAQKNAKGLNKELQKTTASFDEMNILSDTSSSAGGGGGADISTPNVDLTGLQGEIPGWVQWIVDNKDLLISALLGIAGGIIAIKLGADLLLGLGIGLIIAGISKTIKAIIDFIQDPSWDNFAKILEGLAVILTGVAIAMLAVNAANPVAWIILAIAAVVALAAIVIKNWDKIKNVLGVVGSWINDHIIKPIANFFSGLWNGIVSGVTWAVNGIKSIFNTIVSFFGGIINSILGFFKNIGVAVGNVISSAFKAVVNGVMGAIESILNAPIKAVNGLIGVINKVPGINLGKLSTFKLPRLAKGGIINQPGRGVPVGYGQAIGGERGQEGVLPLTDSQQMQLLGEAIGRYVTINATITNTMNGRVISRELQKVNNTNNFAFNR